MTIQEQPKKAFVSVVEMCELLEISKSRFYSLMQMGIFPQPVRHASCKRPVFDSDLQRKCLEIRQTGIALNGQPVLFNKKRKKASQPKPRNGRPPITEEQSEMIDAMKSLGLTVGAEEVQTAMRELFPTGYAGIDQGEVIRRIFLHLRGRK